MDVDMDGENIDKNNGNDGNIENINVRKRQNKKQNKDTNNKKRIIIYGSY